MTKNEAARQLIKSFPHTSKKELGKMLVKLHPILFKDDEDARSTVRRVTGSMGKQGFNHTQSPDYKGPLTIPKGEHNDFSPYICKGSNVLILADIHLPYHDSNALEIALIEGKKSNVDTVLLNGDIIDCYQLSDFDRDPSKDGVQMEIEILCHLIKDIKNFLPGAKIIYKIGNHEERWERQILRKAPAIWGFECFELPNLIKIEYLRLIGEPLDIDFVNHKRLIFLGLLSVVHGHEWRESTFSPVNPARGYYMRAKASVLGGDKHQTSEHITRDIKGRTIGAWSIGCLCDLSPRYMPLNNWNLGFARVEVFEDGSFEVHNHKIIQGRLA